jgi:hypothetical protein
MKEGDGLDVARSPETFEQRVNDPQLGAIRPRRSFMRAPTPSTALWPEPRVGRNDRFATML